MLKNYLRRGWYYLKWTEMLLWNHIHDVRICTVHVRSLSVTRAYFQKWNYYTIWTAQNESRPWVSQSSFQWIYIPWKFQRQKAKTAKGVWFLAYLSGISIGHVSVECWTKYSRYSLVFRICNILILECSTDSLKVPMLFPANFGWYDEQQSPLEYSADESVSHNDPPWKVYTSTMFGMQNDKQCFFLYFNWLLQWPVCSRKMQAKKIMLSNCLWIGPKTTDTVIEQVLS